MDSKKDLTIDVCVINFIIIITLKNPNTLKKFRVFLNNLKKFMCWANTLKKFIVLGKQ